MAVTNDRNRSHRAVQPKRSTVDVERSGHNLTSRTVLILLIALTGLSFVAFFDDPDAVLPLDARITSSGVSAEIRTGPPRASSTSGFRHAENPTQQKRMKVGTERSPAQTIVPEPDVSTLASIHAAWIAGADAGSPDAVLDYLEAMIRAHPVRSREARLARRALDDLLALRDRRLRRDRFDARDEASHRETERRRYQERIAGYAHTLRYDDRAETINEALGALGTVREEAAAVAILAAGQLPERAQRERRIRLLWRMAADGVSTGAGATPRDQLERTAWSSDPGESALAREALADLDHLRILVRGEEY